MIQAARLAPALRRASGLSRALLPPPLALRPVGSGRAGRPACAARMPRGTRRASSPPSPAFASLTSGARRGVPRPSAPPIGLPRTPQPPPSRRVGVALRFAPALGSGRSAPSKGAAWPPARGNRGLAPRSRGVGPPAARTDRCAPLLRRSAPLGRLHGRRRHRSTAEPVPRCRRRPLRRLRAPGAPARKNSAALRVADAPCAYASRKPLHALDGVTRSARAARPLRGLVALA